MKIWNADGVRSSCNIYQEGFIQLEGLKFFEESSKENLLLKSYL